MKYRLIKQEPYFCVPRCLQMILDRNNIPYDSQSEIAKELGFRNDEKYKGTQVQKEEYSIDNYLKRHKIPLTYKYIYNLNYKEVKELLNKHKDDDIVACYKRGIMFGKNLEGGHATIIEKVKNDIVTLIYPEDETGYRDVSLKALLNAIECHGKENMAGFWLFRKNGVNIKESDKNIK